MGNGRVLAQVEGALRGRHPDLELLSRPPLRDDLAFGDLPVPQQRRSLDLWLYTARDRVAYAVLAVGPGELPRNTRWSELLTEHLHGTGARRWTALSIVAMPLLPPFDEPGLQVRPLLAIDQGVQMDGGSRLGETFVASVRDGRPAVVGVSVFCAAHHAGRLTNA